MPLKAFIFDVGDILYDVTLWRKWLTGHLRSLGAEIDYQTLVARWENALLPVYVGKADYWQAFREMLKSLDLSDAQIDDTVAVARTKAQSREVKSRTLFDGVADTIARLKEIGCKLAVLSDTESPAEKVRNQLTELGIADLFDTILTSRDQGFAKPDPKAYQAALDALGVDKSRAAFVGHDEDELTGAMDFGLTAIAFNFTPPVPADHYIWHFSELIRLAS